MPLCVTVLMLLILASSGLRETVAVQAYMAASPRPTWDHSPARKCSPGSMTSGRAYPGRDRPCIHCEAYRMQQHPFLRPPACSGVPNPSAGLHGTSSTYIMVCSPALRGSKRSISLCRGVSRDGML